MIRLTDLTDYRSSNLDNVGDVLARLNATEHLFQLVVDPAGKLCGTVTDGDIRRALLRGFTLESNILDCLNSEYTSGRVGEDARNAALLGSGSRLLNFLPVVNDSGKVVEVLVGVPVKESVGQALVMAGGFGRRLGTHTHKRPKPLVQVGDRPILEYVLSGLEEAAVPSIFVSVHHFADQIVGYLDNRPNRAKIKVLREQIPLGTAGALSLLPTDIAGPILIVNGDVITRADFPALKSFHDKHGYDATIGVAKHDFDIPFGVVQHDEDGLFSGIDEKPSYSYFIAAGIYYLSPEFIRLVSKDTRLDMPALLNMGRKIGLKIGVFPIHEYWADVGRPTDLEKANMEHDPVPDRMKNAE